MEIDAPPGAPSQATSLRAVAVFEAAKGVVALLSAGALAWLGAHELQRLIEAMAAAVGAPLDGDRVAWVGRALDGDLLQIVVVVLVLYAALRAVEAWGLWRARGWASWLGCVGAALYLPIEIRELWRQPGWLPGAVLAINLVVVWVLGRDCLQRMRRSRGA